MTVLHIKVFFFFYFIWKKIKVLLLKTSVKITPILLWVIFPHFRHTQIWFCYPEKQKCLKAFNHILKPALLITAHKKLPRSTPVLLVGRLLLSPSAHVRFPKLWLCTFTRMLQPHLVVQCSRINSNHMFFISFFFFCCSISYNSLPFPGCQLHFVSFEWLFLRMLTLWSMSYLSHL